MRSGWLQRSYCRGGKMKAFKLTRSQGGDHALLHLLLPSVRERVHPSSSCCGAGERRDQVPALRQRRSRAKGGGFFRRDLQEKLVRGFRHYGLLRSAEGEYAH